MPANRVKIELKPQHFVSPLLNSLSDMAVKFLGLRLVIVYPSKDGMAQILVGSSHYLADFCKLVQSSPHGNEHCRMRDLVMAQNTTQGNGMVKRCHSGASTLVKHLSAGQDSDLAILTSCTLIDQDRAAAWKIIQSRGKKLGIDAVKLKQAEESLLKLGPEKMELAVMIMNMAAQALKLILDKLSIEAELEQEKKWHDPDAVIVSAIEQEMQGAFSSLDETRPRRGGASGKSAASPVDIVTELVTKRPNLPYRITAIAAACRITPNHFSFLFQQRHKQCFSEFLTEQRLRMAKTLLKDLTLNVTQVAAGAGFKDAGYFARRFRQKTGVSPREWRQKLSRK